jgi:hypothetical protein
MDRTANLLARLLACWHRDSPVRKTIWSSRCPYDPLSKRGVIAGNNGSDLASGLQLSTGCLERSFARCWA